MTHPQSWRGPGWRPFRYRTYSRTAQLIVQNIGVLLIIAFAIWAGVYIGGLT